MLERIFNRIKRRDTPTTEWLYWKLRAAATLSFPLVRPVHRLLWAERFWRRLLWDRFVKAIYYEPVFKSRCESVGRGFSILQGGGDGMPAIIGPLRIRLGDSVRIMERVSLMAISGFDAPLLTIGDGSYIGHAVSISVAKQVTIGSRVMIGATLVTDNPGHPMLDTVRRLEDRPPAAAEVRPVTIGDYAWLATGCYVFPGCTIGDGAIVLPGATVAGMAVPPFTLVGGNPARVLAKLPLPERLVEFVGEERYRAYKQAHRELKIERG